MYSKYNLITLFAGIYANFYNFGSLLIFMSTTAIVIQLLNTIFQGQTESLASDTPLLGAIPEFDSMAVVSIITALEDQFGFAVDDDEIDASVFETVGTLVAFVEGKL